ncbi:unnamed protein product [Brachionus calyciflorus]|uniref:Protein kinase domain-containing protein n=1 Tax=Brachionus calyciflorus TaxID=104777 RepID=A0A813PEX5_9BILA|nr:unnamed protein product [Brachionus calyciflorus]
MSYNLNKKLSSISGITSKKETEHAESIKEPIQTKTTIKGNLVKKKKIINTRHFSINPIKKQAIKYGLKKTQNENKKTGLQLNEMEARLIHASRHSPDQKNSKRINEKLTELFIDKIFTQIYNVYLRYNYNPKRVDLIKTKKTYFVKELQKLLNLSSNVEEILPKKLPTENINNTKEIKNIKKISSSQNITLSKNSMAFRSNQDSNINVKNPLQINNLNENKEKSTINSGLNGSEILPINQSTTSNDSFKSNESREITQSSSNLRWDKYSSFEFTSHYKVTYQCKLGELIGKGAFGSVYQGILNTGEIVAVKQIQMDEIISEKAKKDYEQVKQEIEILQRIDHINIVKLKGSFLNCNLVSILMDLISGGTIENLLKNFGPFEENIIKIYSKQIVEALRYLHFSNVVHRDIKGRNIMVTNNGIIKLIDFGCSKQLNNQLLNSQKGTVYWMSPEVVKATGHGTKADIWSLGATIFEMANCKPPWSNLSRESAIYAIGSDKFPLPELPSLYSVDAKQFLKLCLIRDPMLRASATDLLNHKFFKK